MKIIVTGGAGFIASHVVDEYVGAGHRVAVIDNLHTGSRKNLNPRATFYKADIRDRAAMDRIFKKERPEVVNHHAALAEVVKSVRDPIPTFETNVLGTANLLLAFGAHGRGGQSNGRPSGGGNSRNGAKNKTTHRKFIFSSTGGAMYGDPKKLPATEENPVITLSPYGLSKHLGEETIKFYARQFGFGYFIFRYANVYGPRQNPKGEAGVVAIFGRIMKSGARPTIFGDGTKARDYVYVGDVARANLAVLGGRAAGHARRAQNETANLGWGTTVSDKKIFDTIARDLGYSQKPVYAPYRPGEIYQISLSAARAKKILGWTPKVALEEGIRKTLATIKT